MLRFLVVVSALAWFAPASARAQEGAAPMLAPGDVVRIAVWQKPEFSGEFEIASDSTVRHPLYRAVKVAGVPVAVAEERLRAFLTRYETTPQFVMEPLFRVSVGGEVRQPNLYTLRPEVTIAQAVAAAGGAGEAGRLDRVRLLRDGAETVLDLTRPGSPAWQLRVRSGDQIVVPRRRGGFREYVAPVASVAGALVAVLNLLK